MIPISDNLKNALSGDTLAFQNLDITVELRDDRVITLDNDDIYQGSFSIDRSVASGGKIEIGSAIASECSVKLVNDEGQFNSYNFLGAVMTIEVVINNERVPLGVFTVDEVKKEIGAISLIALDKMVEFDKFIPVDMAQLPNPLTPKTLINWSCTQCGVTLGSSVDNLPNINYVIKGINDRIDLVYEEVVYEEDEEGNVTETDPEPSQIYVSDLSQITYRNLLQYIGQLTGTCCYIDWEGKLRFSWFTQTSETLTPDNRFSSNIDENPITITGINIKQNNIVYNSGEVGYVLEITDNKLISIREDNVQTIVDNIGNAINGFTYYPFSASILPLIYLMPLDKLSYVDANGNSYPIIITGTNYVVNSAIAVEGVGETQVQHWYADNSGMTNQISTETKNAIRDLKDYLESYIGNFNKVVVGDVRATAIEAITQSAIGKDARDIISKWCYDNDTTYIDGGNIYTGTVTAQQINVNDLFAQDITASGTIRGVNLVGAAGSFSGSVTASSGSIGKFSIMPDGKGLFADWNDSGVVDFYFVPTRFYADVHNADSSVQYGAVEINDGYTLLNSKNGYLSMYGKNYVSLSSTDSYLNFSAKTNLNVSAGTNVRITSPSRMDIFLGDELVLWDTDGVNHASIHKDGTAYFAGLYEGGTALSSKYLPLRTNSAKELITENKSMPFFLGIDAFADGGAIHWIDKVHMCADIGALPTSGGTISVNNATQVNWTLTLHQQGNAQTGQNGSGIKFLNASDNDGKWAGIAGIGNLEGSYNNVNSLMFYASAKPIVSFRDSDCFFERNLNIKNTSSGSTDVIISKDTRRVHVSVDPSGNAGFWDNNNAKWAWNINSSGNLMIINEELQGYAKGADSANYFVGAFNGGGRYCRAVLFTSATQFRMRYDYNGTSTDYNVTQASSDIRLKENVKDTDVDNALELINNIKIRQFDWKEDSKHQKIGFIADELEKLDNELTIGGGYTTDDDGKSVFNTKTIDTFMLQAYEVKAIQELTAEVEKLKAEIAMLKGA